ncbi:MAG: CBM21 domain-containing protein [Verrucomicrobia bacterium]|nr:CBM21 domain-containing protein [Verrucomicrobiota bacterium]
MKKKLIAMVCAGLVLGAIAPQMAEAEHIWFKWGSLTTWTQYGIQEYARASVDIGVWPVAPGHTVGIVYTLDGWRSYRWGEAGWVRNVQGLGGMDEAWIFRSSNYMWDVTGYLYPLDFEFALCVSDQWGNWYWDNNGGMNHHLYYSH